MRSRLVAPLCLASTMLHASVPSTGAAPAAARQPSPACPRLIVPAYFDPGPEWERVIAAASQVGYIILNPNSGPSVEPDAAFQELVGRAQQAGVKVLGYVFTDLGNVDPDVAKAEIRAYQEWYGVDGIHLDGVHNEARFIPYYRDLAEEIRARGQSLAGGGQTSPGIVMLNPGYVPDEGYMEIGDIIETYEWYYDRYPGQEFPDWVYRYPADRFAHVIRNVPNSDQALRISLALAQDRNAGYIYVTDQTDPLDYKQLPSFWDAKVSAVCG